MSTHQSLKLFRNAGQDSQPVVLRESLQKVVDNLAAATADFLQFLDDLLLVFRRQTGRAEDHSQLGVLGKGAVQVRESTRRLVEGGRFDRCRILFSLQLS